MEKDRRTDATKLIVAFRNFANASKTVSQRKCAWAVIKRLRKQISSRQAVVNAVTNIISA